MTNGLLADGAPSMGKTLDHVGYAVAMEEVGNGTVWQSDRVPTGRDCCNLEAHRAHGAHGTNVVFFFDFVKQRERNGNDCERLSPVSAGIYSCDTTQRHGVNV